MTEKIKCDSCKKDIECDLREDDLSGKEYISIPELCPYCFERPIKELSFADLELFK